MLQMCRREIFLHSLFSTQNRSLIHSMEILMLADMVPVCRLDQSPSLSMHSTTTSGLSSVCESSSSVSGLSISLSICLYSGWFQLVSSPLFL